MAQVQAAPIQESRPSSASEASDERLLARFAEMYHTYQPRRTDVVLRGFDLILASAGLLLLLPALLVCALVILCVAGRPILYRGDRVGRFGTVFQMYKFRTLARDAELRLGDTYGDALTVRTRDVVIPLGSAMRTLHLDEVPQLFNVLRGEMSMVGPRPIRPAFYEDLCRRHPIFWQRLVVRPGVTGFAQTRITREESWSHKLAHDLEFIADRSVGLYLRVLGATVLRVARRISPGSGTS